MEEMESPVEHVSEELHHAAMHAKENWLKWSALLAALLAVLAAISGMKSGAEAKTASSERHLHAHEILARAVTLFQAAIAMTAIAVLTRRKHFLWFSAGMGVAGLAFLVEYGMR